MLGNKEVLQIVDPFDFGMMIIMDVSHPHFTRTPRDSWRC